MASGQTSRYGLNQWQPEDKVLREEFNGDNSKVDAALGGLADQMGTKAGQADLDGVKTQMATKAAQSALDSLSASVTERLAKKYGTDNPYLAAGTYAGTGATTIVITTGFRPAFVLIQRIDTSAETYDFVQLKGDDVIQMGDYGSGVHELYSNALYFSDTGFTVNRQSNPNSTGMNESGCSYRYFAFRK